MFKDGSASDSANVCSVELANLSMAVERLDVGFS
jgi:hypothetical protein